MVAFTKILCDGHFASEAIAIREFEGERRDFGRVPSSTTESEIGGRGRGTLGDLRWRRSMGLFKCTIVLSVPVRQNSIWRDNRPSMRTHA